MKAQFVVENLNFKRRLEPKNSLGLGKPGIASKVTADEWVALITRMVFGHNWEEEFIGSIPIDPDRVEFLFTTFKDEIELGDELDYVDNDENIKNYILKNANGRYTYDAGIYDDVWQIVFSNIQFPNAPGIRDSEGNKFPGIFESMEFKRGLEPKISLDLGLEKKMEKAQQYINSKCNWARKPTDLEEVESYKTKVVGEMLGELELIPIIPKNEFALSSVVFNHRNYKDPKNRRVLINQKVPSKYRNDIWGVYADDEEDANYLMDCQGSNYPRYVTKLV